MHDMDVSSGTIQDASNDERVLGVVIGVKQMVRNDKGDLDKEFTVYAVPTRCTPCKRLTHTAARANCTDLPRASLTAARAGVLMLDLGGKRLPHPDLTSALVISQPQSHY